MTEYIGSQIIIEENMRNFESDSEIRNITIYDPQGKQILQSVKSNVDICSLSSGLYIVIVRTDKGIWSDKLVIR